MTTEVDIVNRALQCLGTRTTVTPTELANNSSNEAIQANLILHQLRDDTLRMAPWNCATANVSLIYLTSATGSPENTTAGTPLWERGQPVPPWAYEYMYPDDCLRPLYIVPQFQTGFAGGVPLTTAFSGGAAAFWQGPPVKFKVATDQFRAATTFTIAAGGSGHAVNDIVILGGPPTLGAAPAGLIQIKVTTIGGGGAITAATLQPFTNLNLSSLLFAIPTYNLSQVSTTGYGTGAVVTVTAAAVNFNQARVILTNQEFALLTYVKQVTDPNIMDPLFQDAWATILGARLMMALVGDKALANLKVQEANSYIIEARKADGNEALTINDITPDWIRSRGIGYSDYSFSPNIDFNWGNLWTPF